MRLERHRPAIIRQAHQWIDAYSPEVRWLPACAPPK
jgi:hypothetical protein